MRVGTNVTRQLEKGHDMKTSIACAIVALTALCCLPLALPGADSPAPAAENEVTKNPALLVSPAAKAAELTFYGVKLGDAADKIPNNAAVTAQGVPERTQDVVYSGRDVCFYAFGGKIYRIRVQGDLAKQIPTYDVARLQVALGKADDVTQVLAGQETYVSFFARHVRYTVHHFRTLSVVSEVDLYAP
jgi:hypothetical protein